MCSSDLSAGSHAGSIAVSQTYSSPGDGLAWFFDTTSGDVSVVNLTYTVNFDAQSGTSPSPASITAINGSTYGALASTTRAGYTFGGWWTGDGGTGTQIQTNTTVAIAANQTLYAKWTSSSAPTLSVAQSGNVLTFTWTDASYHLQAQTNSLNVGLGSNWANYPGGATSPVNVTNNKVNPAVFFRLAQ